jgi:uncharacterized membrane protein
MTWKLRYLLASYMRSSLWIIPLCAIVLEEVVIRVVRAVDARGNWTPIDLGVEGAKVLSGTVVTLTLSFIVFTFGSLLVAIQVASGQYTPRIIATTLLRDNVIRFTVGLFIFSLIFAIKTLDRTEKVVPQLPTYFSALLGLGCIMAFLFLIDYAARLLRPVSLVGRVGKEGLKVLKSDYPELLVTGKTAPESSADPGPVTRTVVHRKKSGIVLAVNIPRLVAEAERVGGVIEFTPQVGDFVGAEEPLFHLHGDASAVRDDVLHGCVIFGDERTMEQDPLFAFRILVDIAIKALSAAINDPTTAVLAMDQLHRLLLSAGRRNLRTDFVHDRGGNPRVIFRTPNWDDFVHLAFTEIRYCGAGNIQIARRLRAMLVNLAETLPAERHDALRREFERLDAMLEKLHVLPDDLALARVPDPQGLGGASHGNAAAGFADAP